jgi:hypothetical protein
MFTLRRAFVVCIGASALLGAACGNSNDGDDRIDVGDTAADAGGDSSDVSDGDSVDDSSATDVADDGSGDAASDTTPLWRDVDNDGIPDRFDNCSEVFNVDQLDTDQDGVGDACDVCRLTFDPGQEDGNTDGIGDACVSAICETRIVCGEGDDALCCSWGEECVEGACIAVCGFGIRCSGRCCGEGELCIAGACNAPGAECDSDGDCDYDEFCDVAVGFCLPIRNEGLTCEREAEFDPFDPDAFWHWDGVEVAGVTYDQVMATPMVGDLDRDGVPEVVFPAYGPDLGQAVLVVASGSTGETLRTYRQTVFRGGAHAAIGQLDDDEALEIVIGAIDRIVMIDDPLSCPDPSLDEDGCFVWSYDYDGFASINTQISVALHDLNADGLVEVVMGALVLDGRTGALIAEGTGSRALGPFGVMLSAVADVVNPPGAAAPDGQQELLTGNCAWRVDFEAGVLREIWCADEFADGFPGVADLTGDGSPEVVTVRSGAVYVLDGATGDVLHTLAMPDSGHGGAPNLADFDGDGRVEIGVAGASCYTVYDLDCFGAAGVDQPGCVRPEFSACTPGVDCELSSPCADLEGGTGDGILWSIATQDLSSNMTGSAVFDFQGDGRAEVIYNDECRLFALDGETGRPYLARTNSTRTGSEYPVVVDVDGDGQSEVVVAANNDSFERDCVPTIAARPDLFPQCHLDDVEARPAFCTEGSHGVYSFRDPGGAWVRTRPIWNQHAYSITNVSDEGAIPPEPVASWEAFNTYRANRQGALPLNAPDLAIDTVQIDASQCPTVQRITARVGNRGALTTAPGVPVALFDASSGALEAVTTTTQFIAPGASEVVTFERRGPLPAVYSFVVQVDDDGTGAAATLIECDASNNSASVETTCGCQTEFCDGADNDCDRIIDEDGCLDCGLAEAPCEASEDCCVLECIDGACAVPCRPAGSTCTSSEQCCEGECSGSPERPGFCVGT